MIRVVVVGANGRVGRVLAEQLSRSNETVRVARGAGDTMASLLQRVPGEVDVIVNAAGVAHLERADAERLAALRVGNVDLPLSLAALCVERGIPFVHISSAKAIEDPPTTPYAASKREADGRLEREWGSEFAAHGLPLVVLRPIALLIPPFDAGRLARLRWMHALPMLLTPPLRVPALTREHFAELVEGIVDQVCSRAAAPGFSTVDFDRGSWATLRDVNRIMTQERGGSR